ncbi:MAG TPA: outer membrane beta-barrel protein [Anaeromyxobacteraceae bacterium]|nr:outer membrane beta-barrel protein [Anaeromyxobacteraceae bacterium]
MKKLSVIVAACVAFAAPVARAQDAAPRQLHVAPLVGAYVPTGDQRDDLEDALLVGLQLSYDVHPYVAVVGTFGWAPTEVKGLAEDLDLFQYDLGVQGQYPVALSNGVTLKPFVGAGLGARTYSFRDLDDVDAETDLAGYFSAGGAVLYRGVEVALTARDYLTDFDGVGAEGDSSTRNDLSLFASVGYAF